MIREVSADDGHRARRAELLENLPPDRRPNPFREVEHAFPPLNAATARRGGAMVHNDFEAAEVGSSSRGSTKHFGIITASVASEQLIIQSNKIFSLLRRLSNR